MPYAHALYRKGLADLRRSPVQGLAIALMVAAATAAVTLALILWRHVDDPWQRVFAATNSPHAVFYGVDADANLSSIATLDGVAESVGPYSFVTDHDLVRDGERERLTILGFPAERPPVAVPVLADGRWLAPAGHQEIVLDWRLAESRDIRVGDQIDVESLNGTTRLTVVGLSITAWRGPYPNWRPATAYLLPATLTQIDPDHQQTIFFVRLDDPDAADAFIERAVAEFPEGALCCITSWEEVRQSLREYSSALILILGVCSLFTIITVVLVVANTIGGRMLTQRREIGLLKAAGMTPWQVTILFLVEHLILGVIGALFGLITGLLASRFFLWRVAAPYDAAPTPDLDLWLGLPILGGVLVLVALATIVPAWLAGRVGAADALTPRRRRTFRSSWLGQLAIRLRLPVAVVVGLKDLFARPVRAWLTVVALTFTVTTASFALGMEATLDTYFDGSIWADNPHELVVQRDDVSDGETRRILDRTPGVTGYVADFQLSTKLASEARWFNVRAVAGDVADVGLRMREGRIFAAPGEAIVGQGLLDATGLAVGDVLQLVVAGRPLDLRIVGRYVEVENNGQMAMISFDTLRTVLPDAEHHQYLVQLAPGTDLDAIKADLLSASGGRFGVTVFSAGPDQREVFELRLAVYGVTLLLLAVGLINLITVALLGVRDRVRDLGVLKALGLTPRELVVGEITAMALLAVLAWAIGVPLSLVVGPAVYDEIAEENGLGPGLATMPDWLWCFALIPAAIVVAAVAAVIPARIAARLPVAGALRAE
ncbi:MAG: FtsX-like permease family protein [Thermomicrobiales bacterium]